MTAGEMLAENPDLHIQFGLHATSVRNNLDDIKGVDPRGEIMLISQMLEYIINNEKLNFNRWG